MKIKSILVWPDEVCLGWAKGVENKSEDSHHDQNGAVAICETLIEKGFGCNGRIFPLAARVEIDGVKVFEWTKEGGYLMVPKQRPSIIDRWLQANVGKY